MNTFKKKPLDFIFYKLSASLFLQSFFIISVTVGALITVNFINDLAFASGSSEFDETTVSPHVRDALRQRGLRNRYHNRDRDSATIFRLLANPIDGTVKIFKSRRRAERYSMKALDINCNIENSCIPPAFDSQLELCSEQDEGSCGEGSELWMEDFIFEFKPDNILEIKSSFKNITANQQFSQPFCLSVNEQTTCDVIDHISLPDSDFMANAFGLDDVLSPDETTPVLTIRVKHMGFPFSFYLDANAENEDITPSPSKAVTWISNNSGEWGNPDNWHTGTVPGQDDNVVINRDVTVTIANRAVTVRSINSEGSLVLNGASLTILGGDSNITGSFIMTNGSSLTGDGESVVFTSNGTRSFDGATFVARNGAEILLPSVTEYRSLDSSHWIAHGIGSRIDLSGLIRIRRDNQLHSINALAGGRVDLDNLLEIDTSIFITIDGDGSLLNMPSLTHLEGSRGGNLTIMNNGDMHAPNLTSLKRLTLLTDKTIKFPTDQIRKLDRVNIRVDGFAADFSGLIDIYWSVIKLRNGGTIDLSNVTNIDTTKLSVFGGVTLALPSVTSYRSASLFHRWEVSDPGSRIDLSNLREIRNYSEDFLEINSLKGGTIDLSNLQTTVIPLHITADRSGSLVDLSSLKQLPLSSVIKETNNGKIDTSANISTTPLPTPLSTLLKRANLTIDASSNINTDHITAIGQSKITVDGIHADFSGVDYIVESTITLINGGTVNLSRVTEIAETSFNVNGGVILSLPFLTDCRIFKSPNWSAIGNGSKIDLSGLVLIKGGIEDVIHINAQDGGVIDLMNLKISDVPLQNSADGDGSLIDLTSLKELPFNSTIKETNGGEIDTSANILTTPPTPRPTPTPTPRPIPTIPTPTRKPILTPFPPGKIVDLNNSILTIDGSIDFNTNQIEDIRNSKITVDGVHADFSSVKSIDEADIVLENGATVDFSSVEDIYRATIILKSGGSIDFRSVKSIGEADIVLENGATVDFSSVEDIFSSTMILKSGGSIDFSNVEDISSCRITIDGVHSNFNNFLKEINKASITIKNGATADFSSVIDIISSTIIIKSGGTIDFGNVAYIEGTSFFVKDGTELSFPSLTSYFTDRDQDLNASGEGSKITVPNLTEFKGSDTAIFMRAEDGGVIDLSNIKSSFATTINVTSDGNGSLVDLSSLKAIPIDSTLSEVDNGKIEINIDITKPTILSEANLVIDASSNIPTDQILLFYRSNIMIDGVHADFSNITGVANSTITLKNGGTVDFSNVTSIDGTSFFVHDGVTLSLPSVKRCLNSRDSDWIAEGPGSKLELINLTEIRRYSSMLVIRASNAGVIDLGKLTDVKKDDYYIVEINVSGDSSLIKLSSLKTLQGTEDSLNVIRIDNNGILDAPNLTSLLYGVLEFEGSSNVTFEPLKHITFSRIVTRGAYVNLSNITNIDNSWLSAYDGGTLYLPSITNSVVSYKNDYDIFWRAQDSSSKIDLSNLKEIRDKGQVDYDESFYIKASKGGTIDLSNLTTVDARVYFNSKDDGSTINMPSLERIYWQFVDQRIPEFTGALILDDGTIFAPNLTELIGSGITMRNPTDFNTNQFTKIASSRFYITENADFSNLVDITSSELVIGGGANIKLDNVVHIDDVLIDVRTGTTISLPKATSYTFIGKSDVHGGEEFRSLGKDSKLDLSNLTEIINPFASVSFMADVGGYVDLSNLVSTDARISFRAYDNGSIIDLSKLTTHDNVSFFERDGGIILRP